MLPELYVRKCTNDCCTEISINRIFVSKSLIYWGVNFTPVFWRTSGLDDINRENLVATTSMGSGYYYITLYPICTTGNHFRKEDWLNICVHNRWKEENWTLNHPRRQLQQSWFWIVIIKQILGDAYNMSNILHTFTCLILRKSLKYRH